MGSVHKALVLHTKYDGCLKEKHLCDYLSYKPNPITFFIGNHFYCRKLWFFRLGYLVYIFLKMNEPATSKKTTDSDKILAFKQKLEFWGKLVSATLSLTASQNKIFLI